jgi:putative transposase
MKIRSGRECRTQAPSGAEHLRQILLPMVAGIAATKADLMTWVHEVGLGALSEILRGEAEAIAGPKGKHRVDRTHHHWGHASAELAFGGRRIGVARPRVRARSGREVQLPSVEHFRTCDPLPERVLNQIVLGVSTRGYGRSLEPIPSQVQSRGTSKSAASRHLVARMRARMKDHLSRPLSDLALLALVVDGIVVARQTVVVALGITAEGTKVPLGLWQGTTENAATCTALLQDLLARRLRIEGRTLCLIDGGKGLRKALTDVLGSNAVVQRCQLHKRRNVKDHLPKSRQAQVDAVMRQAYRSGSADAARKQLRSLAAALEREGQDGAGASVREGLEETLTVLKLGLRGSLARSLATTNCVESMLSTVRRVMQNVKRWRGGEMVKRWTALGVTTAEQRFRRIKGYRDLRVLADALRDRAPLDESEAAA